MKNVTVVIPNWNGMRFLKTCLDSLRRQDTDDFETLVVDNHSEDGSVEFIRAHYPEVRLIVHEENLGFTGGVNAGIRTCRYNPAGNPNTLGIPIDYEIQSLSEIYSILAK